MLIKNPDRLLHAYTSQYDVLRESSHSNFEPWSLANTFFLLDDNLNCM